MVNPNVPANVARRDARRGLTPWYKAITEKGKNPNTKNAEGSTLLELVYAEKNLLWFTELLKKGAKLTDTYLLMILTTPGDKEFLKSYYTVNPHLINKDFRVPPEFIEGDYNEPYLRPLSIVVLSGDPTVIDFMISKGAKISDDDILSISHNRVLKEKLEAVKTQANSYVAVPSPLPPQAFIISPSRQKELNRRRNFRRLGLHLTKKRKN
jgi:ankyrin repeat protein